MTEFHPHILSKDGQAQFVVLPYDEFEAIRERLEDLEDLLDLREAVEQDKGEPTISHEQMKRDLGL